MGDIASMALPGRMPTFSSSGKRITPESLFKDDQEKRLYAGILNQTSSGRPAIKVKKVCVKIFDLSKPDEVEEYEQLWADLLEKTSRNEVIVDSQKDLVRRKDGTSYWMKYVEYVEFGEASDDTNSKGAEK